MCVCACMCGCGRARVVCFGCAVVHRTGGKAREDIADGGGAEALGLARSEHGCKDRSDLMPAKKS